MKICIYNVTSTMDRIGSTEVGGVEMYTYRLGEGLKAKGHEVVLFGGKPKVGRCHPETEIPLRLFEYRDTAEFMDWGTRYRRLRQRMHFASQCARELVDWNPDLVFIFKPYDLVAARKWRKLGWNGKIVASIHGPEFYWVDGWLSRNADAFYAVSSPVARAVEGRYRISCPVLPNFIHLKKFPLQTRFGPGNEKIILTVGRLVGWKGLAVLMEAFSKIQGSHLDSKLVIVGDGPERESLGKLSGELGLKDRVCFTGLLGEDAIRDWHRKAWVFVQPSIGYESFSISCLEAAASGVPLLVTDQVEIRQWFEKEMVPVASARNPGQMAGLLDRLLGESEDENRARGGKIRGVVEREFGDGNIISKIEKLCVG